MQVVAKLNNLRLAPRKVRAVVNLVKGKTVSEALDQLEYFVRRPVGPLKKLINSAVANAENNFNMVKSNLYIKGLTVDEGAKLKRFRAKGFGRAAAIQKKTSHIKIILDERTPGLRAEKKTRLKKEASEEVERETRAHENKKHFDSAPSYAEASAGRQGKPEVKREMGKRGGMLENIGKKLFQRKAI